MPKREKREKREKKYSKNARVKKILLRDALDRKETQMIKAEIADYLKGSNGYHSLELQKKMPLDQNSLKPPMVLSRENEKDSKNPSRFFFITWKWLKKTIWWLN